MTDPEFADRTYIEPLTAAYLEEIIRVEAERMGAGRKNRKSFDCPFDSLRSLRPLRMTIQNGVEQSSHCCRPWADRRR